jgi:hypothetical protein
VNRRRKSANATSPRSTRCVESRTLVNPELSSADDAGDFEPGTRAESTAAPSGVGESG